jgi:NADH dehydrogenase [ubiquinone] 1 alpha subcomplex assembly factor 7
VFEMGRRLARDGGAGLVIDYGHAETDVGETLQAVNAHGFADPLSEPGEIDLTAHVDFQWVRKAAECMRARAWGPIPQGEFLRRLGIAERAALLKGEATAGQAADIDSALERLTADTGTGMGRLFKVVALSDPRLASLPGFET